MRMTRELGILALLPLAVALQAERGSVPGTRTAIFAGGCFWGVEWVFEHVRGVRSVVSGYTGGSVPSPTYDAVGSGRTGHVEAVEIVYDPDQISYRQLLEVFFTVVHDPTSRDRQGPDEGPEYRAVVFYLDQGQRQAVQSYLAELTRSKRFADPIVTEVREAGPFYRAEGYHQDYAARHPDAPYIAYNDAPKISQLRRAFPTLFR